MFFSIEIYDASWYFLSQEKDAWSKFNLGQ